jgi:hypothetical protein
VDTAAARAPASRWIRFISRPAGDGLALAVAVLHEVTAMVLAYRSDEDVLQARLGALLDERSVEVARTSDQLRDVYARRMARTVTGSVAAIGGAAVLLGGAAHCLLRGSWFFGPLQHSSAVLTPILLGSMAATALAYLPAYDLAKHSFNRALEGDLSLSGSARIDLVRVERAQPRRIARRLIEAGERASASLPLLGAALLAPLAIHFLVVLFFSAGHLARELGAFDGWIGMSAPTAGFAHLVLAILAVRFGNKVGEKSTEELAAKPAQEGWSALKITALAGLVPGAVLILIPPILISVTGLLFIPLSYYAVTRSIVRERQALAALSE